MKILDWLGFGKKETKIVKYELDPNSIKEHNLIKGQQNQIAELQAIVARLKTEQFRKKELKEQKQEEENIKSYLQEDKKQIDKKSVQKFFSLKNFFSRYFKDEKFRNNLMYTTFDRSTNLAKFGDFGFIGNKFVVLNNQNREILGTRELKDLFQSIGALKNDISSGKIPLNLDKDGGYIENLMTWEAPEIIREDEGFRYSKAKKRPFYEMLKEKDAQIQQGFIDLEEAEETIVKQQERLDELELSSKANEKSGQITRAERVKTIEKVSNIEKIFADTETELTKMRQVSVLQEDNIKEIEDELTRLRNKAKDEGVTLSFDEVLKRLRKTKGLFRERNFEASEEKPQKTT